MLFIYEFQRKVVSNRNQYMKIEKNNGYLEYHQTKRTITHNMR